MSRTLIFHVTVPAGFDFDPDDGDPSLIEEALAEAVARFNGDRLAEHFDGDEYDVNYRGEVLPDESGAVLSSADTDDGVCHGNVVNGAGVVLRPIIEHR